MEWLEQLGYWGLFLATFLAATVVPFSSDALYIAFLARTKNPMACFLVASAGNTLGGLVTYFIGRAGKLEWIEKYFKVSHEKLIKQKDIVNKYGVWAALLSWLPLVGDVILLGLGFYKSPALLTCLMILIGKAGRFVIWTYLLGFGLF